uniref:DH domain-containing protein n=1 Tax=Strongyloides stercoralis TaxID=6248 RepID=A0A0K0E8A8_STRER
MSDRRNSILKQTNDGSSNNFETPKSNAKRRVSFSNKRLVQHFNKTDITFHCNTVMEEMDRTGSSGSPNLTRSANVTAQPSIIHNTPDRSSVDRLDLTSDVFNEPVGDISLISNRSIRTPLKNTTLSVFDPLDFSTPRIEVLNNEDSSNDMDISLPKSHIKTPIKNITIESDNITIENDDTSAMDETIVASKSLIQEDKVVVEDETIVSVTHEFTSVEDNTVNSTRLSTSRKRLVNSYIYRDSPTLPLDHSMNTVVPKRNATPFRRRSLTSSRSRRSNSLRRTLIESMSFTAEEAPVTPARENLSTTLDIDDIKDYSCSQSFINLVTPARGPSKQPLNSESPATNLFTQDCDLVSDSSVPLDKKEEVEEKLDKTKDTTTEKTSCFLDESYNYTLDNTSKINSSSVEDKSRCNSVISQNYDSTSGNKTNDFCASGDFTVFSDVYEKSMNATDEHPSFLSAKYSETIEFKHDGSAVTFNKTTTTAINLNENDYSEDMTTVGKNSEILPPIVEEEEEVSIYNKTINIDEVKERSEELKRAFAREVEEFENVNMGSQGSDIFNETSGFSTDADMSMWNQSDSIVCPKEDLKEKKEDNKDSLTKCSDNKTEDLQNSVNMMDVSMRTVGDSPAIDESHETYSIEKIIEGLNYINPIKSIVYKDNYKECDEKYQIQLAISFIQSILYNESFRHPMLKDYVIGFEKFSFLKDHMIKSEVPLDLDDLFENVRDLKNIGQIIDDFRRINLDVYTSTADQLEVFFDTLYEIYFLLLDHVSIYHKKLLESNNNIGIECSKILNELISEKNLYEENVKER